ncbi:unnamed protein product [Colias eurytheme]|nr:unnamed protein product [Colias eurytheme]
MEFYKLLNVEGITAHRFYKFLKLLTLQYSSLKLRKRELELWLELGVELRYFRENHKVQKLKKLLTTTKMLLKLTFIKNKQLKRLLEHGNMIFGMFTDTSIRGKHLESENKDDWTMCAVCVFTGFLFFYHFNNLIKGKVTPERKSSSKEISYNKGLKLNLIEVFGSKCREYRSECIVKRVDCAVRWAGGARRGRALLSGGSTPRAGPPWCSLGGAPRRDMPS